MKEYVDKSAVKAELERRISLLKKEKKIEKWSAGASQMNVVSLGARIAMLEEIISFLDTIEVKEVDLEKEIKNGIDNLSNLYCYMEDLFNGNEEEGVYPIPEKVKNELFEFAKHFFELGLKAKGE